MRLADLAEERAGERISFADTQVQPRAVITSPEWSGSETRRPALLAVRGQRRAQEAMAHAHRPDALLPRPRLDRRVRRGLPTYRPPLDYVRHFGDQGLRERAGRRSRCAT